MVSMVHFLISLLLGVQWHWAWVFRSTQQPRKAPKRGVFTSHQTCIDPKDLEVVTTVFAFANTLCPKGDMRGIIRGTHLAHTRKLKKLPSKVVALQLKEDFLLVRNYFLIGQKLAVSQTPMWRKSDRSGVPPYLSIVFSPERDFRWLERVLLITYLRSYKSMETWTELPNLSTILQPISFRNYFTIIKITCKLDQVWPELDLPLHKRSNVTKKDYISPSLILSTVSQISATGPSGRNLISRVLDLTNVVHSPFRWWVLLIISNVIAYELTGEQREGRVLLPTIFAFIKRITTHFVSLSPYFDNIRIGTLQKERYQNRVLNRLAIFPDGLGKLRYVALSDFPTQSVLKRLHSILFRLLRSIQSDATYEQGKIYDWYKRNMDKPIFSLDLSAATDRLPLPLQGILMFKIFGSRTLRMLWMILMMTCKFTNQDIIPNFVYYRAGQGIGIYSSWAMMAYTNHFLIRYAALCVGHKGFKDYLILGDDIVIANDRVAESYHRLINNLGIEISKPKSVISTPKYKSLEFASKLLVNRYDISPFPVGTILESRKDLSSLLTLWSQLIGRCLYSNWRELEGMTSPDLGPTFPLSGKEDVQALFGIYFTYVNMYLNTFSGGQSMGLLEKLPVDHPLYTVWEGTPLTFYKDLENQLSNEIRKKFIRRLRLILTYTEDNYITGLIHDILLNEIYRKMDHGNRRSVSSLDLWLVASFLARPWIFVKSSAIELLSSISGQHQGVLLPDGGGVVTLENDRQFISDYLTLLTKGPGFRVLGLSERDYLNLVQLSLGPKSVFLGGQTWTSRVLPGQKRPGRKSSYTLVQATRKRFLIGAMKKFLVRKKHRSVSS
uniref:Putative replicase n=1 Tax=Wunsystermes virus TaxID=2796642 RepID=A0A7T7GUW7_9VIRU|nr:putative replicase [Wunsystermes virus]